MVSLLVTFQRHLSEIVKCCLWLHIVNGYTFLLILSRWCKMSIVDSILNPLTICLIHLLLVLLCKSSNLLFILCLCSIIALGVCLLK